MRSRPKGVTQRVYRSEFERIFAGESRRQANARHERARNEVVARNAVRMRLIVVGARSRPR
jgi:hypothetical protein